MREAGAGGRIAKAPRFLDLAGSQNRVRLLRGSKD